ncbi:MAG: pilus assembly protein PilW [Solimicrobium sp.]|jgi:type IV pilus assembly protein PilW|nr:pilus assembly protein PilW [Solimicrobium sp.]
MKKLVSIKLSIKHRPTHSHCFQQGLTLVELLIATTLGMFVILAITALVVASKATHSIQNDAALIQDTARFALDNISRSIRQAGYINLDREDAAFISTENISPAIIGLDASHSRINKHDLNFPDVSKSSGDVLVLRFFGSGKPTSDNTVLNCAGFGVPEPTSDDSAGDQRGSSIYYVANEADNEPALFCTYSSGEPNSTFGTAAIARGVESFQVLYGIDTSSAADSPQFLTAQAINAQDSGIVEAEINRKTYWKRITAVKIVMLIRGAENSHLDPPTGTYNVPGKSYSNAMSTPRQPEVTLTNQKRLRKMVSRTFQLRNQS